MRSQGEYVSTLIIYYNQNNLMHFADHPTAWSLKKCKGCQTNNRHFLHFYPKCKKCLSVWQSCFSSSIQFACDVGLPDNSSSANSENANPASSISFCRGQPVQLTGHSHARFPPATRSGHVFPFGWMRTCLGRDSPTYTLLASFPVYLPTPFLTCFIQWMNNL